MRRNGADIITLASGTVELKNNNSLRFLEHTSNGANYVELKSPTAMAGNVSMTLPGTTGTANQVLKTDGSGNLSWGDPHVTGSGSANRLAFWSSATGLTYYPSDFYHNGTALIASNIQSAESTITNLKAGTSRTVSDFIAQGTDMYLKTGDGSDTVARFNEDTTYLYKVNTYGTSGSVLYRYPNTSELHHVSSSARFKRNVEDMEKVGKRLQSLRPVRFEGTAPPEKGSKEPRFVEAFGLVAEEVAKVFPDLCYALEGEEPGQPTGVHYDRIGMYLLAGWKEQQAEIETLQERLAVLEGAR